MKRTGTVLMFIGAVMLGIFMFADLTMDFGLWITGFLVSMVVAISGTVMLIIYLARGIKADKASKNDFE
ncbi:hypothetical protein SAMN05421670_3592 [Psychrobacillus psychrotolerans]|uniref:Uncharacterized protein n=1 Tax=Psychrobacillus psychrotolerans TaxID=126156 RepID=A0A1I6AU65_9BACI|nr:hypothetical protein [Psychrobacillus psychrotolerans]SFQ72027.1 hypothetical protein SAMN05421670_3592 [Psychrobacillus psychrotolerans]